MVLEQKKMYRYKLNENCETNTKIFGHVRVSKGWVTYEEEVFSLRPFIRTKENSKGEIDYEEFDSASNAVLRSSYVNFKKKFPHYRIEVLSAMPRQHIVDIARAYGVQTEGKGTDFIIRKVMEKQDIYKVLDEERKEEEKIKKLEKIIEKKIKKILQDMKMTISEEKRNQISENIKNEIKNEKI